MLNSFRKKVTLVSVYEDTHYKYNLGKIWPKPMIFYSCPSAYKDNLRDKSTGYIFENIVKTPLYFCLWVKTEKIVFIFSDYKALIFQQICLKRLFSDKMWLKAEADMLRTWKVLRVPINSNHSSCRRGFYRFFSQMKFLFDFYNFSARMNMQEI